MTVRDEPVAVKTAERCAYCGRRYVLLALHQRACLERDAPPANPQAVLLEWQTGVRAIADRHGVRLEELRAKGKAHKLVAARKECYAYLRSRGWSTPQIGRCFNRHHTSVLAALAGAPSERAP